MGAHDFGYYVKTPKSAIETYRDECEQSTYERGHDGYNGTVSTTHGVQEFFGIPVTEAEATERANKLIDARKVEKWGSAGAIAVYEPEAKDVRKVTRTIKLTGEQLRADQRRGSLWQTLEALRAEIIPTTMLRAGERVVNFEIAKKPGATSWDNEADVVYKTRVVTEASEGAKQTRYFITGGDYDHRPRAWASGHASQAAARAALDKGLREGSVERWGAVEASYGIVAESRREDGSPLVTSRREIIGATVKVEFTIVKVPTAPKRSGWYLFGIAAE